MKVECLEMYTPKISIVIPAYNASNFLAEAIDSALEQTYKNFEIIVVNDGSKDDGATREVAKKYSDKIRYFEKENGGSSSALNCGIKNMDGEWFSWLSHDDLYYPEKLQCQIEYMNKLKEKGIDTKKCVFFSGSDLIDENGDYIRKTSEKAMRKIADKVNNVCGNEFLIAEPTGYIFHGCSCLVHKSVFEESGMFDEKLRLLNDVDFWFRVYSAGYKICYIPKALVKGRIHSKQVSKSIGFSYHNPEQDMYWNRSLEWLKQNHPDNYDLFFRFGRNAYLKTRSLEGKKAFDLASALEPKKKIKIALYRNYYKIYALLRSAVKSVYLKIKT